MGGEPTRMVRVPTDRLPAGTLLLEYGQFDSWLSRMPAGCLDLRQQHPGGLVIGGGEVPDLARSRLFTTFR